MVIVEGDPLKEIGNLAKVSLVMKAGQTYKPADLAKDLAAPH